MTGIITAVKRFAVHDGDGIRTTIFFKGCPLRCVWCHNPETLSPMCEIALYSHKCRSCGKCSEICSCHDFSHGMHTIERDKCKLCGKCAEACPNDAIELFGRNVTVDELVRLCLKDKAFFDESGGGVTLSGGECLLQADFCAELLEKLKQNGMHTAVDTCGFVPKENIEMVLQYTDVFLYDIKAFDEDAHKKCTGQSNGRILENLEFIANSGVPAEIRIPFVPDCNDGEIEKIGLFLARLPSITAVKVLPYHNLARSKYSSLGLCDTLPERLPTDDEIKNAKEILASFGLKTK